MILNPIHQFKLRLGGYSIWSASTSCTIYTDSGLEHLIASMQPKKHSEDYTKELDGLRGWMTCSGSTRNVRLHGQKTRGTRSTRRTSSEAPDTCRTRLQRARGLVRPGTTGLPTGIEYPRVGTSTWLCPTSFVSTRIRVEPVDGLGN